MSRPTLFSKKTAQKTGLILFIVVIIFAGSFSYNVEKVQAALITHASVLPSDSLPSATNVTYAVAFNVPSTNTLECIQASFATTAAMTTPATGMTTGSGFTLAGGGLTTGNWTNYGSANGTLEIYSASARTPTITPLTISWTGVTNSSIANPSIVYAQITTYSTETSSGATCTGQVDQSNLMAILFTNGVATSATVYPSLTFSVAGYTSAVNGAPAPNLSTTSTLIPFGVLTAGTASEAAQLLTVGTNAANGYNLYINKTQTLTDPNSDTFPDQTNLLSSPHAFTGSSSVSSFAVTDDSTNNSLGSNNFGKIQNETVATSSADIIDSSTGPQAGQAVHVEYEIEASNTQAPGTYTTTIIYTAVPSY